MSLVVTPGYTWVNGEVETATKLNLAATPTIADGQAGVFGATTVTTLGITTSLSLTGVDGTLASFRSLSAGTQRQLTIAVSNSTGDVALDATGAGAGNLVLKTGGNEIARISSAATGLSVTGALSATGFLSSGGYKYQTADLASVSGTPADLTGLTLSLVSGNTYSIRGVVYANGGGGSLSPTLLVHGSGGLVASYVVVSITALTSNGTTTTPDMSISFAMEASKGTNPTAGSTSIFMVEVTITVGTSGTFSLQGSRSGSGTATFYKGSFLQATLY